MGSHYSSSTGQKWLNLGLVENSWQSLVPFESLEFHQKYIFKMAAKMVENNLIISHNSAIYEPIWLKSKQ